MTSIIANKKSDRFGKKSKTKVYELIIMFRNGASSYSVHKELTSFLSFSSSRCSASVFSSEYWGLRPLCYDISGNKKSHFYFFSLEIDPDFVKEFSTKISQSEDVIRHLFLLSEKDSSYHSKDSVMKSNLKIDIDKEMGELVYDESFLYNL